MQNPSNNSSQLEGEVYFPSTNATLNAYVQDYQSIYEQSVADSEKFWGERAE